MASVNEMLQGIGMIVVAVSVGAVVARVVIGRLFA